MRPGDVLLLDEILEESFPASDPPANTVEMGISLVVEPEGVDDNHESSGIESSGAGERAQRSSGPNKS